MIAAEREAGTLAKNGQRGPVKVQPTPEKAVGETDGFSPTAAKLADHGISREQEAALDGR